MVEKLLASGKVSEAELISNSRPISVIYNECFPQEQLNDTISLREFHNVLRRAILNFLDEVDFEVTDEVHDILEEYLEKNYH